MQFKDINLRYGELKNGDIIVAKIKDDIFFNESGVVLTVYKDGYLYDHSVLEEGFSGVWNLTDFVSGYCLTGVNVEI